MKKANVAILFISGIALGAIVGGISMYYLKPEKNIASPKNSASVNIDPVKPRKTDTSKVVIPVNSPEKITATTEKKSVPDDKPITNTPKITETEIISLIEPEDRIVVKKDELVNTVLVQVIKEPDLTEPDTLLEAATGIKQVPSPAKITVEFWRSPINYRGYKISRNKIILFGLNDSASVELYEKDDDGFYMKHGDKFYILQVENEFRPYMITPDSLIHTYFKRE